MLLVVVCLLLLDIRGERCSKIQPLIYTPLPNSGYLPTTALGCATSIQIGNGLAGQLKGEELGLMGQNVGSKQPKKEMVPHSNWVQSFLKKCVSE